MPYSDRRGERSSREASVFSRSPDLGYYIIVTDTKETEKNYFFALRDSIPEQLRNRLVNKVHKSKTSELIKTALSQRDVQFRKVCIVFDRDMVADFDEIVSSAEQANIFVGWSNPCIEIWFHSYFGEMPNCDSSVVCCNNFAQKYKQVTKQEYSKSDSHILEKLRSKGNETDAIRIAKDRFHQLKLQYCNPSQMLSCTTIFVLVDEIIQKTR